MKSLCTLSVLVALLISTAATASAGSDWFENFEQAKARAAKDGKDLLVFFTGSDWCGVCNLLKSEVFDSKEFEKEAPKHFVLVELDFPRLKEQPESLKKQNAQLHAYYRIEQFPTVVLTDAKGRPYAKTGFLPGGPEEYLKSLAGLRDQRKKRDEIFAEADKLKGVEKAQMLDKALDMLAEFDMADLYTDILEQIENLDPKNVGGVRMKATSRLKMLEMRRLAASGQVEAAIRVTDEHIKKDKPTGEVLQNVYFMKALALNSLGDPAPVLEALEKAYEAAPNTSEAKHIAGVIQKMKEKKK